MRSEHSSKLKNENVWITILLKSWISETEANATILTGVEDGTKLFQVRMNQSTIPEDCFVLRKEGKSRNTYNAKLHFKERTLINFFPFHVSVLICELELSGTATSKYSFAIPFNEQNEVDVLRNNLISVKKQIYDSEFRIIQGSQAIFIDEEETDNNGIKTKYHPRMYIRFLKIGHVARSVFLFYVPYFSLWLAAALSYANGVDNASFLQIVVALLLTLVAGSGNMIDPKNIPELRIFNMGVLLFVLMLIPAEDPIYVLWIPLILLCWVPFSYGLYRFFISSYLLSEKEAFYAYSEVHDDKAKVKKQNNVENQTNLQPVNELMTQHFFVSDKECCLCQQQTTKKHWF